MAKTKTNQINRHIIPALNSAKRELAKKTTAELREHLSNDVEKFLANGGKVEVMPSGVMSDHPAARNW